ncbi:MAG: DNA alkylation repair protein [Candidatus Paceibacterota bacterium]|jgi:3-methyladenine DNA glycosylase AlkD
MNIVLTATQVERELKKHGNKTRAKSSAGFFKTEKGEYGYGDVFIGVTVPEQRKIAKGCKELPLSEIKKLLASKFHECRLTALLILVSQFISADIRTRERIAKFYLANIKYVNNWDLVDSSAPYILGEHLLNTKRDILYTLVKSKNIWERRIAMLSTFAFIRNNEFADTFSIAEHLLSDTHDLVHKATGWMLREVGKHSHSALILFLKMHASQMPRTALRYAIERLSENERKMFLNKKDNIKMREEFFPQLEYVSK